VTKYSDQVVPAASRFWAVSHTVTIPKHHFSLNAILPMEIRGCVSTGVTPDEFDIDEKDSGHR
jgi:hypothetical protein